jgi:hypothetical protein
MQTQGELPEPPHPTAQPVGSAMRMRDACKHVGGGKGARGVVVVVVGIWSLGGGHVVNGPLRDRVGGRAPCTCTYRTSSLA